MTASAIDDRAFRNPQPVIPGPERSEGARNPYAWALIDRKTRGYGFRAPAGPGTTPCVGQRKDDLARIDDATHPYMTSRERFVCGF
jgi:hypothetical protein